MKGVFTPADILLPQGEDFERWSVIACDQFSSEKEYWDRVTERVGDRPSTLHMVLPEAYLDTVKTEEASEARNRTMKAYLQSGIFRMYENAYIYVEREVSGGRCRRGIVGKLDLEAYDYAPDTAAPVRASEKTVVNRLPPRIQVRRAAALEIPHVLLLANDAQRSVVEPLTEKKSAFGVAYDFDLMEGGGHLTGYVVRGAEADRVTRAIDLLGEKEVQLVVGDGNHSLAAAKACWDELKKTLSEEERQTHPARYALTELCNVYDEGIVFEPIHRIVFGGDAAEVLARLQKEAGDESGRELAYFTDGKSGSIRIKNESLGSFIGAVQQTLDVYEQTTAATVDYIHDEKALLKLAKQKGSLALFMPPMDKSDLFQTVEHDGVFPKKSFSIGHAADKRYYTECRKL